MPIPARSIVAALCGFAAASLGSTASAQTTATTFTYQGQLLQDGQPFTGTADVRVQLYRSNLPIGAAIIVSGVDVVDGIVTLPIDLGAELASFDTSDSFPPIVPPYLPASVELSIRTPSGSGSFTTLAPRQTLNPAPSALGLVNFSRTATSEVNVSQTADTQTFQINANVVQTVLPTRSGTVESVDLKLVNTGAPTPLTLTLRSNSFIFGTSTVTVPTGTNIVTFPFPVGTNISTISPLRLDFNTTTTLGVRYALSDPYLPGSANFLSTADLFFTLRLRGEGLWLSPLSLNIKSKDPVPFLVSGLDASGASIVLDADATSGIPFAITATAASNADGAGKLRIKPQFAGSPAGLTLDSVGNLGINKLVPTAPLHVGGNLAVDGAITLPTTTRHYNVAARACSSLGNTGTYSVAANGAILGGVAGQNLAISAPVNLPNGAIITKLRFCTLDNATENISVVLQALNISTGTVTNVRLATTAGALNAFIVNTLDVSPLPAPIDNATNAYVVTATWTCPTTPANIQIRSLGVEYTVASPLP